MFDVIPTPECPSFAVDCPYCGKDGICCMYEVTGDLPYLECEEWVGSDEAEYLSSEM